MESAFGEVTGTLHLFDADEWEQLFRGVVTDLRSRLGEDIDPFARSVMSLPAYPLWNGDQWSADRIELALEPGDEFYVWSSLYNTAAGGGVSWSGNSLSMSFSDPDNPQSVPPIPTAPVTWLFAAGFISLLYGRRRVKSE